MRYAKANGTFDEGVTDIKALAIRIAKHQRVVHTDEITNAQTTHYTLEIDVPSKAVSFDEAEGVRKRKTGAFFRHRKNGHFILAVESGRHTNPENGNSYRTFAVWKPQAARASYIHDEELSEKYRAVVPGKAKAWWTKKFAKVPPIETLETHIIGGAIIPLWQRFKTHADARLRVVRVTTDEGQRIVGIRIPPEQVGSVVRALGSSRDLREPEEVFYGILDEGEEVILVSGLKLCRRHLHREPVIELRGTDPHKFAELRSLGLLNEQVDWKQRFFVPTDEEIGIPVLTDLLARYPVMASEEPTDDQSAVAEIESTQELAPAKIVDLDEWFLSSSESEPVSEPEVKALACEEASGEPVPLGQTAGFSLTPPPDWFPPRPRTMESREMQLALDFE